MWLWQQVFGEHAVEDDMKYNWTELLESLETLEDLREFISSKLDMIVDKSMRDKEFFVAFDKFVHNIKTKFLYIETSDEIHKYESLIEEGKIDSEQVREYINKIVELRASKNIEAEVKQFHRLMGALQSGLGKAAIPHQKNGRSNRARIADHVFNKCAGITTIQGAKTNHHGNADGNTYDLGMDGAFDGCNIIVIQLYTGEGFDFRYPLEALQTKGFNVQRFTALPNVKQLDILLSDANQLWIISGSQRTLSDAHIKVIGKFWEEGMGLYVFGDNLPFYEDVNPLLHSLFKFQMSGNVPGYQTVKEDKDQRCIGFRAHLVTTGITNLFEGITIATFVETEIVAAGFEPILYDHEGNLIVVCKPGADGHGPVVVDGAFTKLYCQWNDAGSARFVKNCACYLATAIGMQEFGGVEEQSVAAVLNTDGALRGRCELTLKEDVILCVIAHQLVDPEINTDNYALNDPLSVGGRCLILSSAVYSVESGTWIANSGKDPLTRTPVSGMIPAVRLSDPNNRRLIGETLCTIFLNGVYMPRNAFMILLSVADQMLEEKRELSAESRIYFKFIRDEILNNVTSSDSFHAIGQQYKMTEAFTRYMLFRGDMENLRKSFQTLSLIVRTVVREKRVRFEDVSVVVVRGILRAIVSHCLAIAKNQDATYLRLRLRALLYRCSYGVPLINSGHIVEMQEVIEFMPSLKAILEEIDRIELECEQFGAFYDVLPQLVSLVLVSIERCSPANFQAGVEDFLQFLKSDKVFSVLWSTGITGIDLSNALNECFGHLHQIDEKDPHYDAYPPFVTLYGASVLSCWCGETFGSEENLKNLDFNEIDKVRIARNKHFQAVFNAGENGRCGKSSAHFPLHRAVWIVLSSDKFAIATEYSNEMQKNVFAYLLHKGLGNFYTVNAVSGTKNVICSYLQLRNSGAKEPTLGCKITFTMKLEEELKARKRI